MYESLADAPFKIQMQNIGAEVSRALRFYHEGKMDKAKAREKTAVEMMNVVKNSEQGRKYAKELDFLQEEFEDHLNGCQKYDSEARRISRQFDMFL